MDTYHQIIQILVAVYSGANLKLELAKYASDQHSAKLKHHCFGILRNYYAINYILQSLLKRPVASVQLKIILQIAIFEIKYSTKPDYAVTNDLVNLTREVFIKDKFTALVNGVARNYIRQRAKFEVEIEKNYSLKYNLPEWFITKLKKQYKGNYSEILSGFDHHPGFGLRVNPLKIEFDAYLNLLTTAGIEYGVVDSKLYLPMACDVFQLPNFDQGYVSVQDIAAQYGLDLLQKNTVQAQRVLDACAAPGGKTCQLAENLSVQLTALDINVDRVSQIQTNLQRLGLSAVTLLGDAATKSWWDGAEFDLILADVPCSATGTIKRNPDIKLNRSAADLSNFVTTQRSIVNNLWTMLKPNGFMLYITCSIFHEENQANISWFKDNLAGFKPTDELQIFPRAHMDSLYYALIQKTNT